jgi:hypothetical protein
MANADFTQQLTQGTHCPRYVFEDLADIYTGADNNPYSAADLTAAKGNVETEINNRFATLAAAYPLAASDLTIAQNAILASLDSEIDDTYTVNKSAVLLKVSEEYDAFIAITRSVPCPKCKTSGGIVGRYPADGPGGSDPVRVPCETCDTFGQVTPDAAGDTVIVYGVDNTTPTT